MPDLKAVLEQFLADPDPDVAGIVAGFLRYTADVVEKNPKGIVKTLTKLFGVHF